MLLFVSDLHLVDHPGRASFEASALFDAINSRLRDVDMDRDPVTLVLLGDIFELLKSSVWMDEKVRPWESSSARISDAGIKILRGIGEGAFNALFFHQLAALHSRGVKLSYVPGNHDALLGDAQVTGLRTLLRKLVPGLPGRDDEAFRPALVDKEHGVVAEHGHQLDSFNRRNVRTGRFVPGDAVVVEMVVGLPFEVACRRSEDQFSPAFEFLHEMDNVEPQDLSGLMRWLDYQVHCLTADRRVELEGDISAALSQCSKRLRAAMKAHGFGSSVRKALRILSWDNVINTLGLLRGLANVPSPRATELGQVADRVRLIMSTAGHWNIPPDLYVAGHTHSPLQVAFSSFDDQRMTYVNTGTWRRIQSPVRTLRGIAFKGAYHETLTCVHRLELLERHGRFELRSYVRGH